MKKIILVFSLIASLCNAQDVKKYIGQTRFVTMEYFWESNDDRSTVLVPMFAKFKVLDVVPAKKNKAFDWDFICLFDKDTIISPGNAQAKLLGDVPMFSWDQYSMQGSSPKETGWSKLTIDAYKNNKISVGMDASAIKMMGYGILASKFEQLETSRGKVYSFKKSGKNYTVYVNAKDKVMDYTISDAY